MDYVNTIVNEVLRAIDNKNAKLRYDKTFPAVIYGKDEKGKYLIPYEGRLRAISSGLSEELKNGQKVWVKIPCGTLREMHICNIRK